MSSDEEGEQDDIETKYIEVDNNNDTVFSDVTFASLGIVAPLCESIDLLSWKHPSKIQQEVMPHALAGRDLIALAETGSGKTGAFGIPLLQKLLEDPQRLFALVRTNIYDVVLFLSLTNYCVQ